MIIFCLIVLLIFLCPVLVLGGVPVRVEDIFFLGIIVTSSKGLLLEQLVTRPNNILLRILMLFFILNLVSLSWAILGGYPPIFKDMNTIFSVFRNMIVLLAAFLLGSKLNAPLNKLLLVIAIGPFISSIVAIIQYFNLFGLGLRLYLLFGSEDRLLYGISRAIGIFNNPNYAAFFQTIGFVSLLCISRIPNLIYRIIWFVLLVISFLSIFVTFSRTGLLAALMSLLAFFVLKKKIKELAIVIFLCIMVILPNLPSLISDTRFNLGDDKNTVDASMGGRADLIWEKKMEKFYSSPIVGIGPAKGDSSNTEFETTLYDSSFFYLLVTSGVVGFLIVSLFFYFEMRFFIAQRKLPSANVSVYMLIVNLIVLLFFLTTDLIASPIFSSFFYFSIGVFINYATQLNRSLSFSNNNIVA